MFNFRCEVCVASWTIVAWSHWRWNSVTWVRNKREVLRKKSPVSWCSFIEILFLVLERWRWRFCDWMNLFCTEKNTNFGSSGYKFSSRKNDFVLELLARRKDYYLLLLQNRGSKLLEVKRVLNLHASWGFWSRREVALIIWLWWNNLWFEIML